MTYVMTIKRVGLMIGLAFLISIILPIASGQPPPCFTFADGQIQTMQCPVSLRPIPVQYYSNAQNLYQQATDNGDQLPRGFFDQQTIDILRQNAARNQTQTQNQTASLGPAPTNITSLEIEAVRDGLDAARQSLELGNDTGATMDSINRADAALFAIIIEEGKGPVTDRLSNLSDVIDRTRQSVFNLDNAKALEDLNAANSQLSVIREMLPITTTRAIEDPQPQPQPQQQNQSQTNSTVLPPPSPPPAPITPVPTPTPQTEVPQQQQEPTIRIPLNKTQQEIITIEQVGNINKTTHEKITISIIEGNKTTHREVTTSEVPL